MSEQVSLAELEAVSQQLPDNQSLDEVARLAARQEALEDQIVEAETALSKLKAELNTVAGRDLPDAMVRCGLSELKLKSGAKLTVKPYYSAKIPDDRVHQAHDWLEQHGHGGIIKHVISAELGKGENDLARRVSEALKQVGVRYVDKESVNPMTLKAFVREQVENGNPVPLDLFGATVGQRAYLKKGE
jgi:seryl-tRNA synthetase